MADFRERTGTRHVQSNDATGDVLQVHAAPLVGNFVEAICFTTMAAVHLDGTEQPFSRFFSTVGAKIPKKVRSPHPGMPDYRRNLIMLAFFRVKSVAHNSPPREHSPLYWLCVASGIFTSLCIVTGLIVSSLREQRIERLLDSIPDISIARSNHNAFVVCCMWGIGLANGPVSEVGINSKGLRNDDIGLIGSVGNVDVITIRGAHVSHDTIQMLNTQSGIWEIHLIQCTVLVSNQAQSYELARLTKLSRVDCRELLTEDLDCSGQKGQ